MRLARNLDRGARRWDRTSRLSRDCRQGHSTVSVPVFACFLCCAMVDARVVSFLGKFCRRALLCLLHCCMCSVPRPLVRATKVVQGVERGGVAAACVRGWESPSQDGPPLSVWMGTSQRWLGCGHLEMAFAPSFRCPPATMAIVGSRCAHLQMGSTHLADKRILKMQRVHPPRWRIPKDDTFPSLGMAALQRWVDVPI